MKILMVSSFLPFPLFSGGHIRLFNLIKNLSKRHEIILVCEKRTYQTQSDLDVVSKYCEKVITFDRKKQWSFSNILKTGLSVMPFLLVGHTQPEMKKKIKNLLQEKQFDILHAETFYIMHNIPQTSVPLVLSEHNVEYLVYERFMNNSSVTLRPLLMIDIKKLKKWEEHFWNKADRLVTVSEHDKSIMKRKDAVVVPNGVDLEKFKVQSFDKAQDKSSKFKVGDKERRILFIGDFKWIQNIDAASWILTDIWPALISKIKYQKSNIDLKLWIVGRNISKSITNLAQDNNIIYDENADDAVKIFQKAYLLLAPIRVGGGTSFKILEAMASGVPVVTTGIGAEGVEVIDGKEILIAEDSQGFVDHITQLVHSTNQYESLTSNARKLIEKKYDWKRIVEKLEEVYRSAVSVRE